MKSLSFFEEAAEEIEQERQWYRERSVVAEASFLRELDHAVECEKISSTIDSQESPRLPMGSLRSQHQYY